MKQFKGVPGPWVFDDLSMKIKGTGDIEGMTTQLRNATLIASAPEMLHLLNSMMLSIKAHPDYVSGNNQEFIDYVQMAEELINKVII